ncbi:MAG: hypothetical protein II966_08515, partial [Lachnospiraceae bacterium]|nr:hypothetical protein [Lachnospiraceae bacterium]
KLHHHGILPGETNTTVTITLQTTLNQEWVERSTENVWWEGLSTHKNEIRIDANSTSAYASDQVNQVFSNNLKKSVAAAGEGTFEGIYVPFYATFNVDLTGVNEDEIEIEDTFDSCLEVFDADPRQAPRIFDKDWHNPVVGTITHSETNGDKTTVKMKFNPPKRDGEYDFRYFVQYTLIPKGEEGLNKLRNLAAMENGHKITNTAKWKGKSSSAETTYTYVTDSVGKSETNPPTEQNNWTGTFKIVLNKGRVTYGDESYLDVYDFMTNLALVKDSVRVTYFDGETTSEPERLIPIWDGGQGAWKFTIRNGVQADITYDAKVVGIMGKVNYSNYVSFWGYKSDVGHKETEVDRAAGTMAPQVLELDKYTVAGEPLPGAEFTLYKWRDPRSENITNNVDGVWEPVTGNAGVVKRITDNNGHATFFGDASEDGWTLHVDEFYAVKETTAPIGYKQDNLYHPFMIQADRAISGTPQCKVIFIPLGEDGAFAITNEMLPTTEFSVMKVEKDEEGNLTNAALPGAEFKLTPNDPDSLTHEQILTTGKDGKVTFTDIHPGTYTLEETHAPANYEKATPSVWTVTVIEENEKWTVTGDENLSFEIGNKNGGTDATGSTVYIAKVGNVHERPKTGSISVSKAVSGDVDDSETAALLDGIKFKVEKLTEDENGRTAVDSSFTAKELTHQGNGSYGSLSELPIGDYRITEEGGVLTGRTFTTEFNGSGFTKVEDNKGKTATFSISSENPDLTLNVNNSYSKKMIRVTKTVVKNAAGNNDMTFHFILFRKKADGSDFEWVVAKCQETTNGNTVPVSPERGGFFAIKDGQTLEITGYSQNGTEYPLSDDETYYIAEHNSGWSSGRMGAPVGYNVSYSADGAGSSGTVSRTYEDNNKETYSADTIEFRLGSGRYTGITISNVDTGSGNLRIHKMVVNDFGKMQVNEEIIDHVQFRVTNTITDLSFVLNGYRGAAGKESVVTGSDGKEYKVTYDEDSHWTIYNLPSGTYTVEEIADGETIGSPQAHPEWLRITKYDVTTEGDYGKSAKTRDYEEGNGAFFASQNKGQTDNFADHPATVVSGGETQTVHVFNYYSNPTVELQATKNFNGTAAQWPQDGFSFILSGQEGAPMPEGGATAAATSSEPVAKWSDIRYSGLNSRGMGTYVYQIRENIPEGAEEVTMPDGTKYYAKDGILYDGTTYEARVTVDQGHRTIQKSYHIHGNGDENVVTNDAEDFWGMTTSVKYYKNGEEISGIPVFNNLQSGTGEYTPWAVKATRFVPGTSKVKHTFSLYEGDKLIQENKEVEITGSRSVKFYFNKISYDYTSIGDHVYTVKETPTEGVRSSGDVTFTVRVGYNNDGSLKVTALDEEEGQGEGVRTITNIYDIEGTPTVILKKELEGRAIKDGDNFNVEIFRNGTLLKTVAIPWGSAASAPGIALDEYNPEGTNGKSAANGTPVEYTFKEVIPETPVPGVEYDKNTYSITVTPRVEDGKIVFDYSSSEPIVITNKYSATGSLTLTTKKSLDGMELTPGRFSFELKDAAGGVL